MNVSKLRKKDNIIKSVFDQIYDKYDLMNDFMSFGIHRIWKQNLIDWLSPQKNTKLIDVASGTGDIAKLYLKNVSFKGKVFCLDKNNKMLQHGKRNLNNSHNINWKTGRAEKLPFKNNFFDYYTVSFGIRNFSNIDLALKESFRVLKPGGRFICLEFSKVENEILYKLYKTYSKFIPKIGRLITGKSNPYEYLIKSIENFYDQDEFANKIKKAKFKKVKYRNLSGGIAALYSGWKI